MLILIGHLQAFGGCGGGGGTVLAGGGSGGGILLHAPTIAFGPFSTLGAGGGNFDGGGGRILILTNIMHGLPQGVDVAPGVVYGQAGVVEYGPLTGFQLPQLTIRVMNPSQIEVCWPTISNVTYQLESNATYNKSTWSPIDGAVTGDGQKHCVQDGISGVQRLYRVRVTAY